jgi:hypothetical protein
MKLFQAILVIASFTSLHTWADVVTGLYDAETSILSQSQSAQTQAMREGMRQVLVKVSGDPDILQNSEIRAQVRKANDYLLQFNFGMDDGKLTFRSSFDKSKIDSIVTSAGFPIWGARRPSTLFWLAVEPDSNDERFIVSESSDVDAKNNATRAADRRGMTVDFPLLDLNDLDKVHVVDVWGRFMDNLLEASSRYDVESVLAARLYKAVSLLQEESDSDIPELLKVEQGQSSWQLDWNLRLFDDVYEGTYTGSLPGPLIDNLIDQVANQLASRFAVGLGNRDGVNEIVDIKVLGLNNMRELVKATHVLQSVAAISDVSMVSIQDDVATFKLTLLGSEQDFLTALSLERSISRRRDQFNQPVQSLEFVLEN